MLKLKVTTRDGQLHDLTSPDNVTVMEAIRDSGICELAAICGGACSCATCHVHFDAASFQRLEPMLDDEDGLLDGSSHRTPYSRLSCQVRLKPSLDELELQIASED